MTDVKIGSIIDLIYISQTSKKKIEECSEILHTWTPWMSHSIMTWASGKYMNMSPVKFFGGGLAHRLAPYNIHAFNRRYSKITHSTVSEYNVLKIIPNYHFYSMLEDFEGFCRIIKLIHFLVDTTRHSFRTVPVVCGAKEKNSETGRFFYLESGKISSELRKSFSRLREKCNDSSDNQALLFIIEFYVKFLSIHPFSDGNGRTSRCLMNMLLQSYFSKSIFIPLGYFNAISGNSINLFTREAQLFGNYEGLINIFYNIITVMRKQYQELPILNCHYHNMLYRDILHHGAIDLYENNKQMQNTINCYSEHEPGL